MEQGENVNTTNQTTSQAPAPAAPAQPQQDSSTLMGILAYIGILVIIPYLTSKDVPFVKFHIKQGVVLCAIEIGLWVVSTVVWMLAPILMLVNLGLIVLSIIGIVNVVQRKEAELPLVGSLAKHVNI